jgi:hypothetical protein
MKSKFKCAVLVLLVTISLSACVTAPKPQAFNREANATLKRVQILPLQVKPVELMMFNNPANSFGLIGAVIAESSRESKEKWLQKTTAEAKFEHRALFREKFAAAMLERGYELRWPEDFQGESPSADRDAFGLRKQYRRVDDVDAQLDIGLMFVGYAAAGAGEAEPYRPTVNVSARLVSADGTQVLFSDLFFYHNVTNNQTAIILEPDPKYAYPKFDDLEAAGTVAIDGLVQAVEQTALAIAKQL